MEFGQITYATVSAIINGTNNVGGIAGNAQRTNISQSGTAAYITGSTKIGGIIGDSVLSKIENTYALGDIIGISEIGGIIGQASSTNISYSYSIAQVVGTENTENIVGNDLTGVVVIRSYYVGEDDETFGEKRTDEEMKQRATFVDWDFANLWEIEEGIGYPTLR
jgi:hypothetical protein